MRIDEAIRILLLDENCEFEGDSRDLQDALQLGIEALKFIASWNQKQLPQHQIHLPGEKEK